MAEDRKITEIEDSLQGFVDDASPKQDSFATDSKAYRYKEDDGDTIREYQASKIITNGGNDVTYVDMGKMLSSAGSNPDEATQLITKAYADGLVDDLNLSSFYVCHNTPELEAALTDTNNLDDSKYIILVQDNTAISSGNFYIKGDLTIWGRIAIVGAEIIYIGEEVDDVVKIGRDAGMAPKIRFYAPVLIKANSFTLNRCDVYFRDLWTSDIGDDKVVTRVGTTELFKYERLTEHKPLDCSFAVQTYWDNTYRGTLDDVTANGAETSRVMRYTAHPAFSTDEDVVDKKYVDDSITAIPATQWGDIEGTLSNQTDLQGELDAKEDDLGNPATNGQLLSSDTAGARSWVDAPTVITDHDGLTGRDAADQHPIGAITGLQAALDAKEDDLGDPTSNGQMLTSDTSGNRSWTDVPTPTADDLQSVTDEGNVTTNDIIVGNGAGNVVLAGNGSDASDYPSLDFQDDTGALLESISYSPTLGKLEITKLLSSYNNYITPVEDWDYTQKKYVDDKAVEAGLGVLTARYKFTTSISGDPTNGHVGIDNATPANATHINVSLTDQLGHDRTYGIMSLSKGDFIGLQDRNSAKHYTYKVDGPAVDNTGWATLPVVFHSEEGTLNNNENLVVEVVFLAAKSKGNDTLNRSDGNGGWEDTGIKHSLAGPGGVTSVLDFGDRNAYITSNNSHSVYIDGDAHNKVTTRPTEDDDIADKEYVDGRRLGLNVKNDVTLAVDKYVFVGTIGAIASIDIFGSNGSAFYSPAFKLTANHVWNGVKYDFAYTQYQSSPDPQFDKLIFAWDGTSGDDIRMYFHIGYVDADHGYDTLDFGANYTDTRDTGVSLSATIVDSVVGTNLLEVDITSIDFTSSNFDVVSGTPDLQAVTEAGNLTDQGINVESGDDITALTGSLVHVEFDDGTTNYWSNVGSGGIGTYDGTTTIGIGNGTIESDVYHAPASDTTYVQRKYVDDTTGGLPAGFYVATSVQEFKDALTDVYESKVIWIADNINGELLVSGTLDVYGDCSVYGNRVRFEADTTFQSVNTSNYFMHWYNDFVTSNDPTITLDNISIYARNVINGVHLPSGFRYEYGSNVISGGTQEYWDNTNKGGGGSTDFTAIGRFFHKGALPAGAQALGREVQGSYLTGYRIPDDGHTYELIQVTLVTGTSTTNQATEVTCRVGAVSTPNSQVYSSGQGTTVATCTLMHVESAQNTLYYRGAEHVLTTPVTVAHNQMLFVDVACEHWSVEDMFVSLIFKVS